MSEIDHLRREVARLRDDRNVWRAMYIWLLGLMCDKCRERLRK